MSSRKRREQIECDLQEKITRLYTVAEAGGPVESEIQAIIDKYGSGIVDAFLRSIDGVVANIQSSQALSDEDKRTIETTLR